ncbi:uncharacterized protein K441DRAFT_558906, partial [Cenococcum geophilum 1.58]|uniref:uncharacterized protein n=1 Tax=Cenococcum geophilum 1.58 TaxID=794803 RepID=UPI00358E9DD4
LINWRLLPYIILTISGLAPSSTMDTPTIVNGLGYGRLKANAMQILNVTWGVTACVFAYLGKDKWGRRGPKVVFGLLLWWGFTYLELESEPLYLHSLKDPINGSWMALNACSVGERSITLAIFIMSANTLGIIGSQLFQAKNALLYRVGWTIIVALVSLAVVFAVVANV